MTLPKVLAGPILRRCEPTKVYVWIATSIPMEFKGSIHEIRSERRPEVIDTPISQHTESKHVQMGKNLFVHLVEIAKENPKRLSLEPSESEVRYREEIPGRQRRRLQRQARASFPLGEILAYDLTATLKTRETLKLSNLVKLSEITYSPYPLPTFLIQHRRQSLNALYGSCRKLHGPGPDAVQAADRLFANNIADARKRINALFLGGDQIYADDVSDLLIKHLSETGQEIMGYYETMPDLEKQPHKIPIHARQEIVQDVGGLTSGHAHNHLMSFGEFAAMYLLAWNPELWPKWRNNDKLHEDYKAVLDAKEGSVKLRRLLASVPTYMIFDDHEITDDWYLNTTWRRDVMRHPLGKRIIANGLAAFWAFQAWGNDPGNSSIDRFKKAVEHHLVSPSNSSGQDYEDLFINHNTWAFKTPTEPPAIFLNTRTRRAQSSRSANDIIQLSRRITGGPPRLLQAKERQRVQDLFASLKRPSNTPLIVVAPTPVFGLESIEAVQIAIGTLNPSTADLESFRSDPRSFADIMELLLQFRSNPVILLSGDVHYGFSVGASLRNQHTSLNVAQFTSSATKNSTTGFLGRMQRILSQEVSLGLHQPPSRHWWYHSSNDPVDIKYNHGLLDEEWLALLRILGKGPEKFIEQTLFTPVGSLSIPLTGIPLVRDLILDENNFGNLVVSGKNVQHALWTMNKGRLRSYVKTNWPPWSI